MARVERRRRHDPRGRRRADRPRAPRRRAPPPRGPVAQGRQLLRRVERHGDRLRRRRDRGPAAPPRRARVLRLRLRGPLPADRHDRQGRGLPVPAQVRRRAGHAGVLVAKRALLGNAGAVGAGRRHDRVREPDAAQLPPRPGRRARRPGRPRSSSRSAPGSCSRSRTRSAREEIRRREHAFARRALASWGSNPRIRILGDPEPERLAIVSFGVRHPRGLLHSNFVVAVLSDLFGIQARSGCFCAGPYIHRAYPIDDAWSEAMHAQARRGCARRDARLRARQLQLLHQRGRLRLHPPGRPPDRRRGLEAPAALPLRPAHGPLAPRERRRRAAASAVARRGRGRRSRRRRSACSRDQLDEARRSSAPARAQRRRSTRPCRTAFERIRWFPLPGEAHEAVR